MIPDSSFTQQFGDFGPIARDASPIDNSSAMILKQW